MLNFTLIKLSLYFLGGILLGFYFIFSVETLVPCGLALTSLFCFSFIRARKKFYKDHLFGISTLLIFLFLGVFTTSIHLPKNQPGHYINHLPLFVQENLLFVEVIEKLKPGAYQEKFIVNSLKIGGTEIKGKILVNISRDGGIADLQIGDKIAIPAQIHPLNSQLNPYQFDYSGYMKNLGVLRQMNLEPAEILIYERNSTSILALAGRVRTAIIQRLKESKLSQEELAIIQALLLGQRQDISKEVYEHYAAAGVIHILAVSGLHVGIILLLLNWLLKPLESLKKGKLLKLLLLLLFLWSFAVIAGLSPSVVRAVTMFSFIAIGMQLNRPTNVLNTLFMSLLFLLLINPFFVHQVGFQLSYAAVFSIVLIQPPLSRLYKPQNTVVKYFWGILTVTVAAQVGVLPLSLLYFHQFPGLFFVSNLVILPFLGIILGLGLLISALAFMNLLPSFLVELYGWMISSLNNFVTWIASKEEFLFQDIYFSTVLCISVYLLIFTAILLLRNFKIYNLALALLAIITFQIAFIYEKAKINIDDAVIFHKSRNTILGIKKGGNLEIFHNLDTTAGSQLFIKSYKTAVSLQEIKESALENLYYFDEKKVLVIDSSGIYNLTNFRPDLVLLINSPRINLERMILQLDPKIIIADGSNYRSFIATWKETAEKRKLPFHVTGEMGAYILSSEKN